MGSRQEENKNQSFHFEITEDIKDRILNLSLDLICIAGMDGYFKYVNPAWEKTLGYTREELLSRPFCDFIYPDDHKKNDTEVENLRRNQQTNNFENRYIHKDGSIRTISWTATPLVEEKQIYCIGRDITETRQNQRQLQQSLDQIQILLNASSCIFYSCRASGDYDATYISDNIEIHFGHKPAEFLQKGFWANHIHPEDARRIFTELPALFQHDYYRHEYRFKHKNGSWRWVYDELNLKRDENNEPLEILGSMVDITDRRQNEEKIRMLSAMVEQSTEGIAIADLDGRLIFINRAWCNMHGYQGSGELIGKNLAVFHHRKQLENEVIPYNKELILQGSNSGEVGHITKDGKLFPTLMTSIILKDKQGNAYAMAGFAKDITRHKQAEEALNRERNLLKTLMDNIPDHIYFKDINSRFIIINKSLAEDFHIDNPEKAIGKTDFDFFTEEHARQAYADEQNIIKSGKSIINIEEKETRFGNSDTWVSTTKMPLINEKGIIIGTFGISRDITEFKTAVDALRASEMRYRELFDHINSGVAVYEAVDNGRDFIFRDFNQAGQYIEKLQKEQVIGRSVSQVFPAIKEFGLFIVFQQVWKTGKPRHLPVALYKDDRILGWRDNYVYKLPTGEIVAVYEDVTERKKSEEEIQKVAKFPNENPMPVMRISMDGILLYANQACEVILNEWNSPTDQPVPDTWQKIVLNALASRRQKEMEITFNNRIFSFIFCPFVDDGYVNIYGHDITERKLAEEQIRKSLKEKEILIRELYHRTKNNMQVISSILRLRARSLKDTRLQNAFNEIESKILSMALVHQKLYESKDLSQLNLKDYIISLIVLIKQLYHDFMRHISIRTNMKDIHVLIDMAIPLGLVVNELLTNAIKHAFPHGRQGEIQVNLNVIPGNSLVLKISDNGAGLPEDFDFKKDGHLGLQTVFDLVENQLDGKIKVINRKGLSYRMSFAEELYEPRV